LKSTLLKPASFEESGTEMPFVILGNEAYSLKTYVIKSFAERICQEKNELLSTGCHKQGDALSVPLVS
jgi:hypothetical protein